MRAATVIVAVIVSLTAAMLARQVIADVREERDGAREIHIFGKITAEDVGKFDDLTRNENFTRVILDSRGGDLYAAMRIGQLLREMEGNAFILADGECYSSCVLIWLAAVDRMNFGRIGLHRPYLVGNPRAPKQTARAFEAAAKELKSYLSEMRVADSIYDIMMTTAPENMRVFENFDIYTIIAQEDPVYNEKRTAMMADRYGLKLEEYRTRHSQSYALCRGVPDHQKRADCREAAMWKLDVATYRSRNARAESKCRPSDEEFDRALRSRNGDPYWEGVLKKRFACERQVIQGG